MLRCYGAAKHDLNAARAHGIIYGLTDVKVMTVANTDYQGCPRQRAHAVQEAPLATEAVPSAEGGQLCPRTTTTRVETAQQAPSARLEPPWSEGS